MNSMVLTYRNKWCCSCGGNILMRRWKLGDFFDNLHEEDAKLIFEAPVHFITDPSLVLTNKVKKGVCYCSLECMLNKNRDIQHNIKSKL